MLFLNTILASPPETAPRMVASVRMVRNKFPEFRAAVNPSTWIPVPKIFATTSVTTKKAAEPMAEKERCRTNFRKFCRDSEFHWGQILF